MYLHLGQSVVVSEASVLGVFDLDNTTGSHITRKFLNEAEKNGRVTSVSDELPKSFVVCSEENGFRVYLSQLSSQTLQKRSESIYSPLVQPSNPAALEHHLAIEHSANRAAVL